MRILSFGAGAIGTYIGGSLALAGHDVVFLERPQAADSLEREGMTLHLPGNVARIEKVNLCRSLAEALQFGPYNVALLAVKSYDTAGLIKDLAAHHELLPVVFCLQNGVENEALLEGALGAGRVIAGTVTSAIGRKGLGEIVLERKRGVGVAAGSPLSVELVTAMSAAGLNARLFKNPLAMKWSKMLTNLMANATSAILNMTPAEVFSHQDSFSLERAQLREALAVMAALHIPVSDLPGTPVRPLSWVLRSFPDWAVKPILQRGVAGGRGGKMPSFHIDLYGGSSRSEVDYLNGAVVRAGERIGVATPVNRLLNETLLALTSGDLPLSSFDHRPDLLRKTAGHFA